MERYVEGHKTGRTTSFLLHVSGLSEMNGIMILSSFPFWKPSDGAQQTAKHTAALRWVVDRTFVSLVNGKRYLTCWVSMHRH